MTYNNLFTILGIIVVASPALLLAILGLTALARRTLNEAAITHCTQIFVIVGLAAAVAILALMLALDTHHVPIEIGNWVLVPEEHFHFTLRFVFDRLSVPFVILSFLLCGTIGAFASVYMHREPGYPRFFIFYALFLLGMVVSSLAGTIETLFAGWELVGLSSALLVAFFQERPAPVRNGLRVWSVYRIADAAFLIAAVVLHNLRGEGNFDHIMGADHPWPDGVATLPANEALLVGGLLLIAAAGKSALIPFSGWLPRAMEGPTPSSAVFYGALSVHLGAFLLMRIMPILHLSPLLCILVAALGLITALFAAASAQVQTDIKSALSFASLTQIGIIVAEIGIIAGIGPLPGIGNGLCYIPLIHMMGHAFLRTLQFLRAPTLLRDYHAMENAIGSRLQRPLTIWEKLLPESVRRWLYRLALERGYWDALLNAFIVHPFVRLFRWCDGMERRWTDFLSGGASRESDHVKPTPEALEELL
jgi:NADH-quinone oxidoreductase subunit L